MALTPGQVEDYRRKLVASRDELAWGSARAAAGGAGPLRAAGPDIDVLWQIEAALARIADGTYGICEQCHEQIPVSRLDATPSTLLCFRHREISDRSRRAAGAESGGAPSRVVL